VSPASPLASTESRKVGIRPSLLIAFDRATLDLRRLPRPATPHSFEPANTSCHVPVFNGSGRKIPSRFFFPVEFLLMAAKRGWEGGH